ncbi:MAG TPA: carboxymuconolactone decarboxylase family protein [Candidatus Sulfotelmatobacter sp.]|nr:carboxymuconolactone decarboxylase family protein [Candidatus Sulfotelmatobacter sp.]
MNRSPEIKKTFMWRLTPLAECGQLPKELDDLPNALRGPDNNVTNFVKLLARSKASLAAYMRAEEALAHGMLTAPQREKIALVVAEINGSNYCLKTHQINGRNAGLSDAEIRAARQAKSSDPKTEAMLRLAEDLVLQRGEVGDMDFSAIRRAGVSDAEIIEVLANVTLNIFTNYLNIMARTDLDHSPGRFAQAKPEEMP